MNAMKKIVTGVFCLTAAALQAATLQVGPDKAYKTIQAAVDAANTAGGAVSMGAYECMPNGLSVIVR